MKRSTTTALPPTEIPNSATNPRYSELLKRARRRYAASVEAEREIRDEAELDMRFVVGDQWTEKARRERERNQRPVLTFNKLHTPIQQLANQARQNKPAIQISPAGSGADKDTAVVLQGLIRAIEYDSNADQAYDIALENAASCSFAYIKFNCIWADDESFDQNIVVEPVFDSFSIRMDCAAKKPDRSDAMWAFEDMTVSREQYRAEWKREPVGAGADFSDELREQGWITEDEVRVCRYWEVDLEERTLRMFKGDDGIYTKAYLDELEEGEADRDDIDWLTDDDGNIRERQVEVRTVTQYIVDGGSVLDEVKWDGTHIPIIPVYGKEIVVKGKRYLISLTRHSRDPQTLHNYYKTMEAETIALAPKPKWIGAVGQFKSKTKDWQRANIDMAAYLEYDPVVKDGALLPPPTWQTFDPPVQSLNIGSLSTADDIKAGTGYFDPSLGMQKQDQSGVAVQRLQTRGDISNFHFIDNLARALKCAGRYLLELIPKKYDTERELEIIGEDNKRSVIKVNTPYLDSKGRQKHHTLKVGRYSVTVSMGPTYQNQRDETQKQLSEIFQADPQIAALGFDIWLENSDVLGKDRLARRFFASLPPAIQMADTADQEGVPPEVLQLRNTIQQQQQQLQGLAQLLKSKILEMESKERQTTQTNITRLLAAEAQSKSAAVNAQFERDHDAVQSELERRSQLLDTLISLHQEADQAAQDRAHQAAMAQQQMQGQQQQPAQQPAA